MTTQPTLSFFDGNDPEIPEESDSSGDCCCERENPVRHEWIAVAAYFKAERRGFALGHEWDDWLDAEREYAKTIIAEYLANLEGDGHITLSGLQKLADSLGVEYPERLLSKIELIRAIQSASRMQPCFRTGFDKLCNQISDCQWRTECKKMIASWKGYE